MKLIKIVQNRRIQMNSLQKIGGVAALIHAVAYVVGIVLFVSLLSPLMNSEPGQYMAFVVDNQALMYIWILICYWVAAAAVVVMALALYERLQAGSTALVQTATVFGFIWAGLIIGSGNLMLNDFSVVADLYHKAPAQAETVWLALEAVENGLVSGNELVGSLWVLLLSLAAWRTGRLTRALNYLGLALGMVGLSTSILAFIPAVKDFIMTFGLGMIGWSVWVGIVMVHSNAGAAAKKPAVMMARPRTG
jgi:hypothetical protein